MSKSDLKTYLIRKVSEINDASFPEKLKIIPDSATESGIIQLTSDQMKDITVSRKEIEQGKFVENKVLDKQVHQWLRAR